MDMKTIADLKPALRSVVVSCPTPVNVSRLLRDYRKLNSAPVPMSQFGYSDAAAFLRDHFSDCFIFEGNPRNPTLVPIVPESVQHIDRMVSKQWMIPKQKYYRGRKSVQQKDVTPHTSPQSTAYNAQPMSATHYKSQPKQHTSQRMSATHYKSQPKQHTSQAMSATHYKSQPKQLTSQAMSATHYKSQPKQHTSQRMSATHYKSQPKQHTSQAMSATHYKSQPKQHTSQAMSATHYKSQPKQLTSQPMSETHYKSQPKQHTLQPMLAKHYKSQPKQHTSQPKQHTSQAMVTNQHTSQAMVTNQHTSQTLAATHHTPQQEAVEPTKEAPTASANGTDKPLESNFKWESWAVRQQRVREQLHKHVRELLDEHPEGIWCVDLKKMYKGKFGVELTYLDADYASLTQFVFSMGEDVLIRRPESTGDWHLHSPLHPPPPSTPPLRPTPPSTPPPSPPVTMGWCLGWDGGRDARRTRRTMYGDSYYEDVFPEDCARPRQKLPPLPMDDVQWDNTFFKVIVGEVYSPSHMWLLRLGEQYEALMQLTDEMNDYYGGRRGMRLSAGATFVGHLCAKFFDTNWRRAIIVQVLDETRVKLRHVDYGTVEEVDTSQLMALRIKWTDLPAQAMRARLSSLKPAHGERKWPVKVTEDILRLVGKGCVNAECILRDKTDGSLQVVLHTPTPRVCINWEMLQLGHAVIDLPPRSNLGQILPQKRYHMPPFEALEDARTLSYSEVVGLLNRGLDPWDVKKYAKYMKPPPDSSPPMLVIPTDIIKEFRSLMEVNKGREASDCISRHLDSLLPSEGPHFEFL